MHRAASLAFVVACRDPAPPVAPPPRAVVIAAPVPLAPTECATTAQALDRGLVHAQWTLDARPIAGGLPCVDVVTAEPARYRLRAYLSNDDPPHTATEWRDIFHLATVINAGMFHDNNGPVGLLVADGTAHGHDNAKMSGFFAWDPRSPADAPIAIAGRDCPGFDLDDLRARYRSIVQSYRLLGCNGEALPWKDPKHYSAAGIGLARDGHVVLLHARAALTMAELSTGLASHDLAGALFLEGGPEASLVAHGAGGAIALVGSYETDFLESDTNATFWKLPNILGLEPR